jgi:hypothetical protein
LFLRAFATLLVAQSRLIVIRDAAVVGAE